MIQIAVWYVLADLSQSTAVVEAFPGSTLQEVFELALRRRPELRGKRVRVSLNGNRMLTSNGEYRLAHDSTLAILEQRQPIEPDNEVMYWQV